MKTVKEIKDYAMKHYNNGGDVIIECWTDKETQQFIDMCTENGKVNESKVKNNLDAIISIHNEYWEAARYFSGESETTETNENNMETNNTEETEEYNDYSDYDSCYGCPACDHSYNCKHCPHGDDGCYESPLDVYTPSELGISVSWR